MRVSTEGQVYGLEAQHQAIQVEAERRGWDVEYVADAGRSGRDVNRPGIQRALADLRAKKFDGLVVSKLDRLARSLVDLSQVLDLSRKQGWSLTCLDLGIDTSTPTGELVASVMGAVAQWERRAISARTKEGLAEARRAGKQVGSPVLLSSEVAQRIVLERRGGSTYAAIARALNDDGVPLPAGGRAWLPGSVAAVVRRSA